MKKKNEWGFTNDIADFERVVAWREAAIADGWSVEPTYQSEPPISAARLKRGEWTAQIITRQKNGPCWKYEADVHVWGPDRLSVDPGDVYDWAALQRGLRHCHACGKDDVDTQCYSFAGRCCADCRPEMARIHEKPGWCD